MAATTTMAAYAPYWKMFPAMTLARALKRTGGNVDAGLSSFEEMQVAFGRGLVDYGVALGRRWAAGTRHVLTEGEERSHG